MNEPNTNPALIAADIARRVTAMAQDSAINNENLILTLMQPLIQKPEVEPQESPAQKFLTDFMIIAIIATVICLAVFAALGFAVTIQSWFK